MLTYWEILTAIQSNVPVNDSYAQLWGRHSQNHYTRVTYIGTHPATLTGTKAGYLRRYKIYGNTEQTGTPTPDNPFVPSECGERTENLVDFNRQRSNTFVLDTTKYIYGARADRPSPEPRYIAKFGYNADSFMVLSTGGAGIGFLVEVKPNTTYTALFQCNVTVSADRTSAALNLITSDGTFGTFWGIYGDDRSSTFTTNADTAYVYLVFRVIDSRATYSNIMLVEGSIAPTEYIPYGYKLPLTAAGQDVDIYIGDDTLSAEEYIDSGTGKIYRMVGGVLTPVDPPVQFPQIPTSANSTTISWAGGGLTPSKIELEYEKKR